MVPLARNQLRIRSRAYLRWSWSVSRIRRAYTAEVQGRPELLCPSDGNTSPSTSSLWPRLHGGNQRHSISSPHPVNVVALHHPSERPDHGFLGTVGQDRFDLALEGGFLVIAFRQTYPPTEQRIP